MRMLLKTGIALLLAVAAVATFRPQWLHAVGLDGVRPQRLVAESLDQLPGGRTLRRWIDAITGGATLGNPRGGMTRGGGMASVVRGRARVIDGDSLRLNGVEVRLHGIDAPELRQQCRDAQGRRYACGRRARRHLRRMLRGQRVTCRRVTTDRYGRMVARCTLPDGADIARRMVRDGWAVAFVRYSRAYVGDERAARRARRGMWNGRFVPPAAWRRAQRQ